MQLTAIIDDTETEVTVAEVVPDVFDVSIDGAAPTRYDARQVGARTLSLLPAEGGAAFLAEFSTRAGHTVVEAQGHSLAFDMLDLRQLHLRKSVQQSGSHSGLSQVTAPMPGKVVAVLVTEGQEVEANQGLVVVEAMKMENELRAPKAGVVRELSVSVGMAVESGVVLCVVE